LKTYFECIPCILTQAIITLDLCKADFDLKRIVVSELLEKLKSADYDLSPSENTDIAYEIIAKHTGVKDPYYHYKREHNKLAIDSYQEFKKILNSSQNRLYCAAKIAIAGNVIDLGISHNHKDQLDFSRILKNIVEIPLAIDDFNDFAIRLKNAKNVLYIADNAGEIIFDRVFIEELVHMGKKVTVSVKSGPIINDANLEDALEAGLDKIAEIIEAGHNKIGNSIKYVSDGFLDTFYSADLIISKGQGNFETLSEVTAPVYFLLKAKCKSVAAELGVNYLDVVFVKNRLFKDRGKADL